MAALTCNRPRFTVTGKKVGDVLYVKHLVGTLDRFLKSNIRHGVFNIGGGPDNTLSLLELLELLRKLAGKEPKLSFSGWRPADQKVYVSDIRKAQQKLSWKPTIPPQEGVKRLVNWVEENEHQFI